MDHATAPARRRSLRIDLALCLTLVVQFLAHPQAPVVTPR